MKTKNTSAVAVSEDYVFQFAAATARPEGNQVYFAARASGLFCSHDGGQTWKFAYTTLNAEAALLTTSVALAPDFGHDPAVFAGLNGTILRSYDGGIQWQHSRLPTPPPAISALAISPNYADDGIVFAGTNEDGVLVSNDRGMHWVSWNFGLLDLHILCLGISPGFAADETLFAGTESGIFRSTNGGRAWKEVPLPIGFDAILSLALSPHFNRDGTLLAGTENQGLLISRDEGKSWQLLAEGIIFDPVNQILLSPISPSREIFVLHGGTLLVSKDGGTTWRPWKAKWQGDCNVTVALALENPPNGFLLGFEDGRILLV